jgi:hypothetical protein
MRQLRLDPDALTVETFAATIEEPVSPASTTVDASLWWCVSTSGGQYFCLADCA